MECPRCHSENPSDSSVCLKCGQPFVKIEDVTKTQTVDTPLFGLALGSLLAGRYHVLEELGSGGMGRVYKVFDQETRENLAIKLLRPDISRDNRALERFRHELKVAHQLSHKNICRVYHLGREGDSLFITMEYVPGEDLKSFIRRSGQLSVGKAVRLARQICEGLGEAHRLGYIHRDLKPQNVMIDPEGNAKIMDFGIARSFQEEGLTGAGHAVGTPSYMAPEQAEGKEVDERTDIYALGTVLYEMITGKPPFEGDTVFSVAYKHVNLQPAHPASLNPLVPDEMSQAILKCLQKDKRNRFQNVGELCAALEKIESQISGSQGRARLGLTQQERLKARRKFLAIAALSVAVISVLIVAYFIWWPKPSGGKPGETAGAPANWINSIAVLPFEDLSLDRSLGNICESMTDNITTKLISTGALTVISRYSAGLFIGQKRDPLEIGRELNVANILEATLQTQEDLLLVNVKIVRTQDGAYLFGHDYSAPKRNRLMLEDDISKDAVVRLGVKLTTENREKLKRRDPREIEDYDVFLLGRHFERRYSDYDNEEDFQNAVKNLGDYEKAHPDYALVYCSLGNVYEHRFAIQNNPSDEALMRFYYEKAYQIDPDLEETNLGMGWAYFYKQDYDTAYEYIKKAAVLGPNNPEVNWNVGSFFRSIGLDQKAVQYYEKALISDPLNSSIYRLCAASNLYIGQYEKGLSSIEKAISLERENVDFLTFSARLLLLLRRPDEAEERIAKAQKIKLEIADIRRAIQPLEALVSALNQDRGKALFILRETSRLDQTKGSSYDLNVSSVYALLGMKKEAIHTIEEGIKNGFEDTKMELYSYPLLGSYPYFESLRDAPEFKSILEQQKKLYEIRRERFKDL